MCAGVDTRYKRNCCRDVHDLCGPLQDGSTSVGLNVAAFMQPHVVLSCQSLTLQVFHPVEE